MSLRDFKSPDDRREEIEKILHISLATIGSYTSSLTIASEKNCENMIGAAQIPLGVAGPLKIEISDKQKAKSYFIPLATTEGALVASINRGCKAITEAGGAIVDVSKFGMTRGPVFYTGSIKNKIKLYEFVKNKESRIKNQAEKTSKHLKLKKILVKSLANYTFLRFVYDTKDAMGMNMATIATQAAVEFIEKETGIACLSIAGNFDIDKKPAWINSIEGRGLKAWAEVVLNKGIVKDVLKTTPQKFFDVWLAKCMLGSAVSGSIGFNGHIANVIAAIFIATGQDPAHVVEGSLGITTAKVLDDGSLYVGVFLPSLLVGTVGGGTGLPTQKEALLILGLINNRHSGEERSDDSRIGKRRSWTSQDDEKDGTGKVEEFAGIVTAACLAGEISLIASLSEGTLAKSHQRLARNPNTKTRNPKQ